jgi:hypothetical protein
MATRSRADETMRNVFRRILSAALAGLLLCGCGGDSSPSPSNFAQEINLDTLARDTADDTDIELSGHTYSSSHTITPASAVTRKTMSFRFQATREKLEDLTTALRTALEEQIRGEDGEIINSELSTRPDAPSVVDLRYRIASAVGDVRATLDGEGTEAAPWQMTIELNETVGSKQNQPRQ